MKLRDRLQQGIYKIINPFVKGLIKIGLTPNMVTSIGLMLNIGVAIVFIIGAEKANRGELEYVGWAGALVLFAGLFDMLDGQVARLGNMSSKFGALYDSVLDRYSELVMFLGICYYLVSHHYFLSSLFAFIALIGSMMVSYTRARAEGLGIECKGGLMQRPERVVTIGVFAIACGIAYNFLGGDYKVYVPGVKFHVFETMSIFTLPITIMAVMTNITAINRLRDAKKALDAQEFPASKNKAALIVGFALLLGLSVGPASPAMAQQKTDDPSPIAFPVPRNISNQLFYVQRDPNTNTIICQLNINEKGELNKAQPVNVFWMRYADKEGKKDLNYIQRKFAYGIQSKDIGNGNFELRFVSYKKFPLLLTKSALDKKYHVYVTANNKRILLDRIFLRIEGGTFWVPNVKYVELKGYEANNPTKAVTERIKV
jgi:phosphatidylglycerophosphate synthase